MDKFNDPPSFDLSRRFRRAGAPVLALAVAMALGACQPKPTVAAAAAPVVTAPAPPEVVAAAVPAPTNLPTRTLPVPTVAAPATTVAVAAQPVPVYNDAGPPPTPQAVVPGPAPRAQQSPVRAAAPVPSDRLGRVTSVEPIRERPEGTGAGGVAGAAIGGLVGNHFGHGTGRAALTVLGLAGGAVAGNNVERNLRERTVGYRVGVRLDNGDVRTFEETGADLRVGDRVRVAGHSVRRV